MNTMTDASHPDPLLESSIRVVVAYLGRNAIKAEEIPELIGTFIVRWSPWAPCPRLLDWACRCRPCRSANR
jgi:hypothetical protein